ncbi:Crp/Fnr family transcriptional regulator [Chryseobacterium formosus]|uniref:Crp/Fnr family transcriptional regulator n=1 Tax=Chryseobacterium formosus TaxID=1537363 RepID=A0ABT3XPQ4_9FLAO|nr:Crp/Fnr family transcriptional regulator [Chryseobacterium formosus]MCX8523621.1 Crp/Fnr family transcriptional regulator [Chryseobacterium formosus]
MKKNFNRNFVFKNKKVIEEYFRSFNIFKEEEIRDLVQLFEVRKLAKNDFFANEGEKCNEVAFIKSGIFRSYYTTSEGNDMTYCFRFPNDMLASYSSFITGNPSLETLQAISSAELLVIGKDTIDKLTTNSYHWTMFLKIIAEQNYIELEKRIFQLQKETAIQRYTALVENQPEFIQQIPLQYLASYLNITQRHLSRIRKEITF